MTRRLRAFLPAFAVAVLFALPLLPEIVGARLLIFRDAQITHWPWHRVATAALDAGEVPFINAAASGGQPLLANPNAVLLYPTFLLERVLAPEAAFNLHYLLHIFWAFLGARVLARRLGMGDAPSFVAGVAFAFSGMVLSYGSAFMNSSAAASWLPWCAAAFLDVARANGRRALLSAGTATGLALGLQLLAGEPALSLLTLVFGGVLVLSVSLTAPRGERTARLAAALCASAGAGLLALALAAPLLLPLRAVFPLTYRGQHLYSERASGAAAFSASRAIEWLFPRFGGDPDLLGGGANWIRTVALDDVVYIWCVTLGIVPLLVLCLAALRKDFWDRRSAALAAGGILALLFSFGFSLPFYRLIYSVEALRKLRYPIKFYLLTTLCTALLAGLAADVLGRRRTGRREAVALAAVLAMFAAGWWMASPGGALDRWAGPLAQLVSEDPRGFLEVFRGFVRGDALIGALVTLAVALMLRPGPRLREPAWVLGFLVLVSSFAWGLPLFVSAPASALVRPPALLHRIQGPGRLYVSPALPKFDMEVLKTDAAGGLPRTSRVARIVVEQLVPLTGAPFGVRYLFENDPDGFYGFFNRLANEAADASTPSERDRLLALYGARWVLAQDTEVHPLFHSLTGLEIAGRRLVLFENPRPVAELRWAGRVWRRAALSGTIELVRSDRFDQRGDVALPGRRDEGPAGPLVAATLETEHVGADHAAATVEAEGAGHLLFARTFFPAWRARVDGRPVPIAVANARDLAVAVPAGGHRVEFEYDRSPFRLGVALQAVAFALAAAVAARASRTARDG
jgi:hypothetical protein